MGLIFIMISFDLNGFEPIIQPMLDVNSTYTRSPFIKDDEVYVVLPVPTGVPKVEPEGLTFPAAAKKFILSLGCKT